MILIAVGRFIQYLILLITLRVSTTILSPIEMGKVSLVVATIGFFAMIFINPVGMFINRRFIDWNENAKVKKYFSYFWMYLFVMSFFAELILFILVRLNVVHISIDILILLFLVGGTLFFGTINQVSIPTLNLLGFRRKFMVLTIATSLVSLFSAIAFTLYILKEAQFWLGGILLGQSTVGLIGLYILYQKLNSGSELTSSDLSLSGRKLSKVFSFSWPIAIAVGLGWFQSQAYRFQLASIVGFWELGLFVAGFGISAGLIAGVDSMLSTYFGPIFYRRISNAEKLHHSRAWQEYANAVIPSLMLTGFLITALAPQLTMILLGPLYKDSAIYIIWGALAEIARTAAGVYGLGAHAVMNTRLLITPSLGGAAVALVAVQFLVPIYGVQGAGAALFFAALTSLLLSVSVNRGHIAIAISFRRVGESVLLGSVLLVLTRLMESFDGSQTKVLYSILISAIVGGCFLLFQWYLMRKLNPKNSLE